MKKLLFIFCLFVLAFSLNAQNFGSKLGKSVKNAAESTTIRKAEQKTDQAISKGVDEVTNPNNYNGNNKEKSSKNSKEKKWKCSCGHNGNTGKFCTECGEKQPSEDDGKWTCGSCGHKENTGKFCAECGTKHAEE